MASLSANSGWITPSHVNPSQCNSKCNGGNKPLLVYALGVIGYDLGTEASQDALMQGGLQNPNDPTQVLAYLDKHPWDAASLIWTLNIDQTPIYAIQPAGPFAAEGYNRLREFLRDQMNAGVQ